MTKERVSQEADCEQCGSRTVSTVGSNIDGRWYCYNCAEAVRSANRSASHNERIEHALSEARRWNGEAARLLAERDANEPKPRNPNDPAALAERVLAWMQTPEGQESMRKAAAESEDFREKLRAARNIPWEKLHEPFTI